MTTYKTVVDPARPMLRACVVYDEDADQPWGDALAPALVVYRDGDVRAATDVYVPDTSAAIVRAARHFADAPQVFEQYLRIYHGTTAIERVDCGDYHYLIFDTAGYRTHVGVPADDVTDLSDDVVEWQAYADGDVFGIIVERCRHGVTTWDDGSAEELVAWIEVESWWGFYGVDHALLCARDLLTTAVAPMAPAKAHASPERPEHNR